MVASICLNPAMFDFFGRPIPPLPFPLLVQVGFDDPPAFPEDTPKSIDLVRLSRLLHDNVFPEECEFYRRNPLAAVASGLLPLIELIDLSDEDMYRLIGIRIQEKWGNNRQV